MREKLPEQLRERLAAVNLLMLFEAAYNRYDSQAMVELLRKAGIPPVDEYSEELRRAVGEAAVQATLRKANE